MVRRHGDMCRIGCGLARKGHTVDQCGSQIRDADGMSRVGMPARNPDRIAAGRGSPAAASSMTTWDTHRSNAERRVRHHV